MPSSDLFVRHLFGGGFATDIGPSSDAGPQGGGGIAQMVIPWLLQCDNAMFDLDGGITKSPGTTKINASALESGATIRGVYDFWIQGGTGSPSQKRIVHVGTKIKADAGDGNFSDIATVSSDSAVPSYCTFNDELIISDDANSAPKKWTGTGSASALGGSPPNFAFAVEHKGRVFAAGNPAQPSRLYYSAAFNHESWNASTDYITIGSNDGSGITGLASYKDALIIFKGPKKGSIYVLQGDDTSTFSLSTLRKNCGSAIWHNAIFQYQDDLAFVAADGSIQRLSATSAFGNFSLAHLTRNIGKYINNNVARTYLRKCCVANWESKGVVLVTLPVNSSATTNMILMMDYRFGEEPRFSTWTGYSGKCSSMALAIDESDAARQVVLIGGTDGYVRKLDVNRFSIDGTTAINCIAKTPHLSYGAPHMTKVITGAGLGFAPLTDDTVTFKWERDNGTYGTLAFDQGGGDLLAPSSGTDFTLDTSVLGGAAFVDTWYELEEGGEFRNIAYTVSNADVSGSFALHSLSTFLRGAALSMENA